MPYRTSPHDVDQKSQPVERSNHEKDGEVRLQQQEGTLEIIKVHWGWVQGRNSQATCFSNEMI